MEGLVFYEIAKPLPDYKDAEATGRCVIYCTDVGGTTLTIGVVYGWTGGRKNTAEAARTDDVCAIVLAQLAELPPGPKMMAADLNGTIDAFPTIQNMLKEQG